MYPDKTTLNQGIESRQRVGSSDSSATNSTLKSPAAPPAPTVVIQLQDLLAGLVDIHAMQVETIRNFSGEGAVEPEADRGKDRESPQGVDRLLEMTAHYVEMITRNACVLRQRVGG